MKTLASRLAWARTNKGLSQQELARRSGVSQSTIGNLESGLRLSSRKITVIASTLDVDALWLAEGKGCPTTESMPTAFTQAVAADAENTGLDTPLLAITPSKSPNEHIQAVIKLMESTDDKGRRKIRDAAEETLAEYDAHLRRIGAKSIASDILNMSGLMSSDDVFSKNKEKEQN
jgi:transcriptional regulator with XRE-family HTH domain